MNTWIRFGVAGLAVILAVFGASPCTAADASASGALEAFDKDRGPLGSCPLKHTDVVAELSGIVGRVSVTQEFDNPYESPIEAVYTFPLPERAAVDSMTMTIGDRVVKAVIKTREEAQRTYQEARNAGKTAGLLDQERPNIFTQSVANILPGSPVKITITYIEYLRYEDGEYVFSFPMVVGPRYIPGQPTPATPGGSNQVPDAGRITPPVTPEGVRAGHDISLTVKLDAGVPVLDIRSILHEVETERDPQNPSRAVVRLKNQQEIPNRDFILRYKVAGEQIQDAVLVHQTDKGGFFTLVIQPPDRIAPDMVTPKEMLFVIDCSGSMRGFPIEKAKETMRLCIEQMNPDDTFNLVSFSGGMGYCFPSAVPNNRGNRDKALQYLGNLEGSGGTEMMPAIRAALEGQQDGQRLRIVCFMTDGFIGNDMEILAAIRQNVRTARVFAFGIGNGVNRFLIEGMAREGRGAAEIVTLESAGDTAAKRFHERVRSPLLTGIRIDFGGLPITDACPAPDALPDLFSAQPIFLTGRYAHGAQGEVTVRGDTARGPFERRIPVSLPDTAPENPALAPLWARSRIDALMANDWSGIQQGRPESSVKEAVTRLGLEFSLVTQFTSFVAVEEKVVNQGGKPTTIQVPVEMTDGVSYEGVFGEAPKSQAGEAFSRANVLAAPQGTAGGVVREALDAAVYNERVSPTSPQPSAPPAPLPLLKQEESKAPEHTAKLDPALRGLLQKLVNGAYSDGKVRVENGRVKVVVYLTDDSEERLTGLKNLGVKVVGHSRSGKKVFADMQVADLERVAALEFVSRIEPPNP